MILSKRNYNKGKNSIILPETNYNFHAEQPRENNNKSNNFLISTKSNNKKKYKQLALTDLDFNPDFDIIFPNNTKFDITFTKFTKSPNLSDLSNSLNSNSNTCPNWFDWKYYLNKYKDLTDAGIKTKEEAYKHWSIFGEKEDRNCMKNHSLFKQYPNLFHKYLLGIENSESPLIYEVVNETNICKKYICSIHCYDLKNFNLFFGEYLKQLMLHFNFIVTYVEDIFNIRFEYDITFIKIQNRGMDIGSKFITVDYLKQKNVDYSYVFFLHSKSHEIYRKKFITPFILNLPEIIENLDNNYNHAVFNGEIHMDYNWGRNCIYMKEIISYFNLDPTFYNFPAGNFYIISKSICESLFSDIKLHNILNKFRSFDYSWVKNYYNLTGDYKTVYNKYVENKLYGNNVETKLGHAGMADCMIEHVFERLMFLICKRDNKNFLICDKTKGKIIFNDTELTVSVMACHSENSNKINAIINNVNYLQEISDIIYIIDTDFLKNNNLIQLLQDVYPDACINYNLTDKKAIQYINDNPDLSSMSIDEAKHHFKIIGHKESNRLHLFSCFIFVFYCENYGYCYGKWRHFYENIATEIKYKNYILTNDSFLITRSLSEFDSLVKSNKFDLISLNSSNEISYHYSDFLRNYNLDAMNTYINFITSKLIIYSEFQSVIENIEIPSFKLFNKRKCIYEIEPDYFNNIHFDNDKIMHYLNELNYPIVKIKKIGFPCYGDMSTVPSDFDPIEYVKLYQDLKNIKDPYCHFLNHGMKENRYYKKHQKIYIYPPLKEYLLDYVSQNSNICKIDFENYTT